MSLRRFLPARDGIVLLALLLALALRLLLWSGPLHQPANDETEYIAVARDLLAGRGWQFYDHYHWLRAPLYPLWLAGSLWLAGGDLHRAALPNILLSTATVWLNYRLALALAGRRAARVAALITAVLWTLVTFASLYMGETLFTFCFTAGLLCLMPGADDERRATGDWRLTTGRVVLAGLFFGLATLTRSALMLFLPVVALWLLVQMMTDDRRPTLRQAQDRPSNMRRFSWSALSGRWSGALVFLLALVFIIAPWTARNYRAYGRFIAVETGLSYNLWAFNEPRESGNTIFRTLENIPNPAERSDYATAKGMARLREDPAILLRKLWPNWVALWRVKPIEDRFLQENYYGDVPLPLFATALLLDDALYFVIALAGIAGMGWYWARAARPGFRALLASPVALHAGWLLYTVATIMLTHGEGRYRHFLFPVLIPYAAWLLARRRETGDRRRETGDRRQKAGSSGQEAGGRRHRAGSSGQETGGILSRPKAISKGAADDDRALVAGQSSFVVRRPSAVSRLPFVLLPMAALVVATFLLAYPWGWAAQNLARGWYAQRADVAWARGDGAGALALDTAAIHAQETPDGWLRLGDHARAAGETRQALQAYRAAVALQADYPPAVAHLGDMLRATGDLAGARRAFTPEDIGQQELTDWSWRVLTPVFTDTLAIGDGLDFGYVAGMYPAEALQGVPARWTDGRGLIRFGAPPAGSPAVALLRLRLAAPRPDGAPVTAQVCAGGKCQPLVLGAAWQVYLVPVALDSTEPLLVELCSPTFEAGGRRLGVQISAAGLVGVQ